MNESSVSTVKDDKPPPAASEHRLFVTGLAYYITLDQRRVVAIYVKLEREVAGRRLHRMTMTRGGREQTTLVLEKDIGDPL